MSHRRKEYQPKARDNHSTVRVGDYLYMWGGYQTDLTYEHDSEKKQAITSFVEVCHLPTGKWEQKPTKGKPPLGVWGYASAVIGNEIYYFGGACNHDDCHHNSLHSLNVHTLEWREHFSTSSHYGPKMKRGASMVEVQLNGEVYLAIVGGCGPLTNNPSDAQNVEEHFNEIHYYCPKTGKWMSPTINGDTLPPVSSFTLTSLTSDSAVLFGGATPDGPSDSIYLVNFTKESVDITELSKPEESVEWPEARDSHSSVLINNQSTGPQLLVVGGKNNSDCCNDCWLFDINEKIWNQLDLPENVAERYDHSLSVWNVSPSINWIIMNGGRTDWSIIRGTKVIELKHNRSNKKWSVAIVPSKQHQDMLEKEHKAKELNEKWIKEGFVELTLTRVQMLGPPGSGKTCSQHLLLNEDPPPHKNPQAENESPSKPVTDSTPIACRAVKAIRISSNDDKKLKRITRDEMLQKLASNLKEKVEKNKREMSSAPTQPSGASRAGKSKQELVVNGATNKSEDDKASLGASAGNAGKHTQEQADLAISENLNSSKHLSEEEVETSDVLEEIIDLIPEAKAELTDEWVYIIDSGGQPAFQELLPLFTRAASLNIVTLDISKPLNEECDYQYRINGQSFRCDKKLKYTNCKHFESTILNGSISQKLNLHCVTKQPEHSMYFVIGTHYDEFERAHPEEVEISLADMNEKLMSSLPPHVINKYIIHNVPQESIIFPVNTLLPADSEDRKKASKFFSSVISKRYEVSLKMKVPIRWFVFELQLEKTAESKGLSFVTKEEAIAEGKRLLMNEEAVEEALKYLHNCTIILYYPEVKPQLVFVSPQILLDVLSHLLALTYVDYETALSLVPRVEEIERQELVCGNFTEALLKKFVVFSGEFQPGYFINLLEHLHIIAKLSHDTYFLPCALPAYDDTRSFQIPKTMRPTIKPLRLVWRIKEKEWKSEVIVPVPRGSFHLAIVHLIKQKESTVVCFNNSKGVKQFRDMVSLLISVTEGCEPNDNLYIIDCKEYIEVHYTGSEEHCPKVRELVKAAIAESVSVLSASCGDLHSAFACQRDNTLCCFVNEDDDGTLKSTFCDGHECDLNNSYLCWFKTRIAKENNNTGLFNPDAAYKAITACTGILKKGLSLESLVEKLIEVRIISSDEKREVLDKYNGLSTDQRMDKVLDLVKESIEEDGDDFGLFIEIIRKEDTKRADRIIKKLLDTYNELNA